MHDKQSAAMARYRGMAGQMKKLPSKARKRATLDHKRYGARYLKMRRGRVVADTLRMMRFLVEVCGLTLQEAGRAVRKEQPVAGFGLGRVPGPEEAARVAKRLIPADGRSDRCRVSGAVLWLVVRGRPGVERSVRRSEPDDGDAGIDGDRELGSSGGIKFFELEC